MKSSYLSLFEVTTRGDVESIKAYVQTLPQSVRWKHPHTGLLPLHELLAWWTSPSSDGHKHVCAEAASILIQSYPQSLLEADPHHGNTPLHMVVQLDPQHLKGNGNMNATSSAAEILDTFDLIYSGAKCVASYRNHDGQLPIHVAMQHGHSTYVKLLLQNDYCGMNASVPGLLRLAISQQVRSDVIVDLIYQNPSCTTEVDDVDGLLPIQYALTHGHTSANVILAMVDVYPESLSRPDKDGELPLHICAGYYRGNGYGGDVNDRVRVLGAIGAAFPLAYSTENMQGQLPLHLAVVYESSCQSSVVATVTTTEDIGDDEQDAQEQQQQQQQQLHQDSLRALGALTAGYPQAHQTPDGNGNLPLHIACQYYQADTTLLAFLVHHNPSALRTVNYSGCFPLHVAAGSNLPVAAVDYLIQCYPHALYKQDLEGSVPLHHAVRPDMRDCFVLDAVQLLLGRSSSSNNESARHVNAHGELPYHVACRNPSIPQAVLDLLQEAYPEGTALLACTEDFDVATSNMSDSHYMNVSNDSSIAAAASSDQSGHGQDHHPMVVIAVDCDSPVPSDSEGAGTVAGCGEEEDESLDGSNPF